ncbi:hypothetical protein [Nocardia sp. NPDC059239]|uniref:hypothetical protein n=1 Tax=unclassified Nocardia TaxID=2637762 RepID=UPI0036CB072B
MIIDTVTSYLHHDRQIDETGLDEPGSATESDPMGTTGHTRFLGANTSPKLLRNVVTALRQDNESTPSHLVAMMKAMLPR